MKVQNLMALAANDKYLQKGFESQLEGDLERSAKYFIESINRTPSPEGHTLLAFTFALMGELDEAILECERALQLNADFGYALNAIGAYHLEKGRFKTAQRYLKKALKSKIYAEQEQAHFNLARALVKKELFVSACKHLRLALNKAPDFSAAQELLQKTERLLN